MGDLLTSSGLTSPHETGSGRLVRLLLMIVSSSPIRYVLIGSEVGVILTLTYRFVLL
jgi:hypothetical protein